MATITITIPNPVANRVIDSVCERYGYEDTIEDDGNRIPNPISKAQFAKQQLIAWVKDCVTYKEGNEAGNKARQEAIAKVEAEIQLS